mgnify:FL=1
MLFSHMVGIESMNVVYITDPTPQNYSDPAMKKKSELDLQNYMIKWIRIKNPIFCFIG